MLCYVRTNAACYTSINEVKAAIAKDAALAPLQAFSNSPDLIGTVRLPILGTVPAAAKLSDLRGVLLLHVTASVIDKDIPIKLCAEGQHFWAEAGANPSKRYPFTVSNKVISLSFDDHPIQLWANAAGRDNRQMTPSRAAQ